MHSSMLGAPKMKICATPGKHFGRLQVIVGKHVFDLQQAEQKQHSAYRRRQMNPPGIVLNRRLGGKCPATPLMKVSDIAGG